MITFTKMHGCGNDFIMIKDLQNKLLQDSIFHEKIPKLCNRHYGIGADGLILVNCHKDNQYHFSYFNYDGQKTICGNGLRCFLKYLSDENLISTNEPVLFSTDYGLKQGIVFNKLPNDENSHDVKVEVGIPIFKPNQIPIGFCQDKAQCLEFPVEINNKIYSVSCVSFGNPHCVIFVESLNEEELLALGSNMMLEKNLFPEGVNVEMVRCLDEKRVQMKVYERGVGITQACGTGACAVGVICYLLKKTEATILVIQDGGDFEITIENDLKTVMKASATNVFTGQIDLTVK